MADSLAKPITAIPLITPPDQFQYQFPTYLAQMAQAHGPVLRRALQSWMAARMSSPWALYLVGPEANRLVLHTQREVFSHDLGWTPILTPVFERGLLNTDNPAHAHQRHMMNPAFAIAYMSRYLPIMAAVIARETANWLAAGTVDMYEAMRRVTFGVAAEALVGLQAGSAADRLRNLFYTLLYGEIAEGDEQAFMHYSQTQQEMQQLLLQLIAERRQEPTDDILGLLVRATDEDGREFTDLELLGQVQILLVAGHETTTTLSSWLLAVLAREPAVRDRLRTEIAEVLGRFDGAVTLDALRAMTYLGQVIDETGRLYSPVGFAPRGTVREIEFAGYQIPAGTRVNLALAATHRLPTVFADPDRFDPDRFAPPREEAKKTPYSLVTFGGGPRICLGINFAQIEVKALAVHVLTHFDLALIPDHISLHAYYGPTASIDGGLPLRVTPRA